MSDKRDAALVVRWIEITIRVRGHDFSPSQPTSFYPPSQNHLEVHKLLPDLEVTQPAPSRVWVTPGRAQF